MTPDEICALKRIYGTHSDEDVATELKKLFPSWGYTVARVKREAARLCLGKDKRIFPQRMPRWKSQEVQSLHELYPTEGNEEIARLLGRTIKSVVAKAHNLGLKKDASRLREMGEQNVKLRRDRAF